MSLKKEVPHNLLKSLLPILEERVGSMREEIFKEFPLEPETLLDLFRTIRKAADDSYKLSLRISQVCGSSMECISRGSAKTDK